MKYLLILISILTMITACSLPEIEDVVPPVAAIIYPYQGAVISSNVNIEIQAYDTQGIRKVWYYVDGQKMDETTSSPFSFAFSVAGIEKKVNHVMMAAAEDKNGNIGYTAPVTFMVAETPDIIPPQVAIVNPVGGQVVGNPVNIVAHATDDRSVQKVWFFIDGQLADSASAYPYSMNWNTDGFSDTTSHTLFAKAIDGGNNESISPVITVTLYPHSDPVSDTVAPTALFLYPINASIVTGTIQVSVDVQDNVSVHTAEFYVDGALTQSVTDPSAPWIFSWNTAAKADSSQHSLYVKVFDAAGNVGTSGLMTVTVQ